MKTYEFEFIISNASYDDDDLADRLFEAGCDDALLSFSRNVARLSFMRESNSFLEAMASAVVDAQRTGVVVERVLPEDLVNAAEIGRRMAFTKQYASDVISGKKGPGDFPTPTTSSGENYFLWSWLEVVEWFWSRNDNVTQEMIEEARIIRMMNDLLHARKMSVHQVEYEILSKAITKEAC